MDNEDIGFIFPPSLHSLPHMHTISQTFQTLYDPFYIAIYNVVYTSLPVVALAILDQVYTDFFILDLSLYTRPCIEQCYILAHNIYSIIPELTPK